jgi:hypothetical protein
MIEQHPAQTSARSVTWHALKWSRRTWQLHPPSPGERRAADYARLRDLPSSTLDGTLRASILRSRHAERTRVEISRRPRYAGLLDVDRARHAKCRIRHLVAKSTRGEIGERTISLTSMISGDVPFGWSWMG